MLFNPLSRRRMLQLLSSGALLSAVEPRLVLADGRGSSEQKFIFVLNPELLGSNTGFCHGL